MQTITAMAICAQQGLHTSLTIGIQRFMSLWYTETFDDKVRFGLKVLRTLHSSTSDFQTIELFETEAMGKTLALDGLFQTSEGDEYIYHEMIAHPALTCAPSIENVLVIGGGDGGTTREVLRHPGVKRCVMVEIDGDVVEVCRQHIPHFGAWNDSRLELHIADGIDYVAKAPSQSFDVVLLDNSDPVGPSEGLFNRAFYENVKKCLKPSGILALQSESPILMPELFDSIHGMLKSCFARVHPYFAPVLIYGAAQWSWTFASDSVDPLAPAADRVAEISTKTRYYNHAIHKGAFALPNELITRLDTQQA